MVIEGEALERCVPHRGRMALLSRVVQYDADLGTLSSEVDVKESDLFFDGERGGVPSWVGFEYMAQSIAAFSGILRINRKEEPRIGFIMGVRNFKSHVAVFAPGQMLRVDIRLIYRDGAVVSFECGIAESGTQQAWAVINAVEVPEGTVTDMGWTDGS